MHVRPMALQYPSVTVLEIHLPRNTNCCYGTLRIPGSSPVKNNATTNIFIFFTSSLEDHCIGLHIINQFRKERIGRKIMHYNQWMWITQPCCSFAVRAVSKLVLSVLH